MCPKETFSHGNRHAVFHLGGNLLFGRTISGIALMLFKQFSHSRDGKFITVLDSIGMTLSTKFGMTLLQILVMYTRYTCPLAIVSKIHGDAFTYTCVVYDRYLSGVCEVMCKRFSSMESWSIVLLLYLHF